MAFERTNINKQKKIKRRFIFRMITLIVMIATVIFALVMNLTKDDRNIKIGDKAPDFELIQINDNHEQDSIQLSDLEGKGVMITFWASFCEPCESQMSFMETLYSNYQDDMEIIAVSLDNSELVIHQFIDKFNLTYPVVHDVRSEMMDMYSVSPIPTTFFIDAKGEIIDENVGSMSYGDLETSIKKILPLQGE